MFTRRDLLKGFIGASAVAVLSACAPKTETTAGEGTVADKEGAAPATKEKTKLALWHWWGQQPAGVLGEVADMFREGLGEEMGIDVELQYIASEAGTQSSQKLMTSIVGGTPPDISVFDRFLVASWASQNLFVPLDDYTDAVQWDKDDFIDMAIAESTLCNRLYAMAHFTDCTVLWWRKDHFREAGLDPERGPQNRDELDEYAELLTKKRSDGSYERLGLIPRGYHYGWAYAYLGTPQKPLGENFWDFDREKAACDDPRIVECVTWMKSYADKYDIDMVDAFRAGFGGGETDPFGLGLVSMQRTGDWMLTTYRRYFPDVEFGISKLPIPEGLSDSSCGGGWCFVIPAGSAHPDEAFTLANYITGQEAMAYYCEHDRHLPVRKSVMEMPFNLTDPDYGTWLELLPNLWNRPAIPAGQVLWTEIVTLEDMINHDQVGIVEGLQQVNVKVNDAMSAFSCSMLK